MASEVDICNTALGHLGDRASVSSIDPPEGSAQAAHCAIFYPIARDAVLELHTWGFAKRRIALAEVANPSSSWAYAYAVPDDCLNILAILDSAASDDFSAAPTNLVEIDTATQVPALLGAYTPQPYDVETNAEGQQIILTNVATAVCRYTLRITDSTKFSPLCTLAISYFLASLLAGPVLKGETGAAAAKVHLKAALYWIGEAKSSDANDRNVKPVQQVGWIAARG